jgi:hypothetical protein
MTYFFLLHFIVLTVRVNCRQPFETFIDVQSEENGRYSVLKISTGDRPGLLTDIVRILKDISVNVVSAEVRHPVPCVLATTYLPVLLLWLGSLTASGWRHIAPNNLGNGPCRLTPRGRQQMMSST